ncbi:hypothetical protein DPMN_099257 [Dreissena polymorpha]|uniref:Uncharacterized protein n=1 Tax=Dreissena polymorpha TaxID=45954 RepID=A0A9D4R812_DREPO|nr:hypothetical protein DPMN_099257 [Dreissena polymorpha]
MSRRTRNTLPIADELQKPKVVENVRQKKMLKHQHSKFQYDKGAKDLPEMVMGQSVCMAPLPNDRDKKMATRNLCGTTFTAILCCRCRWAAIQTQPKVHQVYIRSQYLSGVNYQ